MPDQERASRINEDRLERERLYQKHGPVLAIGGAEEKTRDGEILTRFVELAGGSKATIVVIPTASSEPDEMAAQCLSLFKERQVADRRVLDIRHRADANTSEAVAVLNDATGIFVTGGAQARLVKMLIGTQVMDTIRLRNTEGAVVAGTSAGASVLPRHMLLGGTGVGGDSGDTAARKSMVEVVGGLNLLPDVIIDQHFSERGRMGRLLSAFAANPGLVGIGLDENTAVLVHEKGVFETLGDGMVTIVDGRDVVSDYFEKEPGEILTITHSSLHVLGPGRFFDLISHSPVDDFDG
jgi:cyanophycinase